MFNNTKPVHRGLLTHINKVVSYKEIMEDYILEGRNLEPMISNIMKTRSKDIFLIRHILVVYFSHYKHVIHILDRIDNY